MGNGKVGDPVKACPLKLGGILAVVRRNDAGTKSPKALKDVTLSVGAANKPSGGSGSAEFKKLTPGPYVVNAALPPSLQTGFDLVELTKNTTVAAKKTVKVEFEARRKPTLKVNVFALVKGKRRFVQATVAANGLTQSSVAQTGVADFSYVVAGTYDATITALLGPDLQDLYVPAGLTGQAILVAGNDGSIDLEVKPINVVTPKIEVEYQTVVFDRDLAQHQTAAGEAAGDLLRPDPTYVEVSLSCSATEPDYDGEGTLAAANCSVFLDAACTQALGARKLTNDELTATPPTRLYLKGTTRGAFALTLTLDPSATLGVLVKGPATVAMGVVEMELEVRQHATPVNVAATTYPLTGYCVDLEAATLIPAQVAMSDADKVRVGRMLHVQSGGNHGRAQALLKLTQAQWPAGTDDYLVVLDATSSEIRVYDAETKGKRQSLPLKLKVSDLKAGDKTLWIEGTKASDAMRATRLSLALDRAAGGLAKSPKPNADWARFTVVKIDSVKLEHAAAAAGNPEPWNASKHRWYINYQAGDVGRTVTVRAKLTKPLAGVKLHFMLSPDKENLKEKNWGIDLPATWDWDTVTDDVKQKDKANATDLLHKSEDTDAQGQADCDLVLSRFGGDQFVPGVYITQDPHLAAYVHGHVTLAERKPKLASDPIKVWRKFAYQKIKVDCRKYPKTNKAESVYGRVRADMFKRRPVKTTTAQVQAFANPALMPQYMFKVGGSSKLALNVSDANQGQFFGLRTYQGEHPISVPVITCDFNWGEERNSGVVGPLDRLQVDDFPLNIGTDAHVCDPPLQGGVLLVSGDWVTAEWDATAAGGAGGWVNRQTGPLVDGDVDIDRNRTSINALRVNLPSGLGATTDDTRIWITNLVVQGANDDFLGGYNCDPARSRAVVALFDPDDANDYQNTVVHEFGHAFFQTMGVAPAAGIPPNPNFIATPTGPHCDYGNRECVMYTEGSPTCMNRYCPDCHPHLLVRDMTAIK